MYDHFIVSLQKMHLKAYVKTWQKAVLEFRLSELASQVNLDSWTLTIFSNANDDGVVLHHGQYWWQCTGKHDVEKTSEHIPAIMTVQISAGQSKALREESLAAGARISENYESTRIWKIQIIIT